MSSLAQNSASPAASLHSPEFQRSLVSAIYEATPHGILVVDANGHIVFHNPRFFELWGISQEDAAFHRVGLSHQPLLTRALEKVKHSEEFLARIEVLYAHPEMEENREVELIDGRTLDYHSKALRSRQGELLGRIWFFRDVTEHKQAENRLRESENRFRQMFESNDAVMLLIEPESGRLIDANRAASRFYGYTIEKMRSMCIDEINTLPPEQIAEERRRGLKQQRNYFIFPHRKAGGEMCTVEVHSSPITVGGRILLFSIIHDITRQYQAEQELKIAAIAFDSQEGMFVTDADKVILRVNRAFTEITGYTAEEVIGQTPHVLSSGRHEEPFYADMWEHITRNGTWQGEIWNRRKSGEMFPEWLTITAVRNHEGKVTNYVAALMDISLRKASEERINQMAFHDMLTHLPNRRMLMDRLSQAIAASKRSHKYGAVFFLDLDNFKPLNDTHGHVIGDMLLIEVAERLKNCVRETDTISRFGGDEFVVLLGELGSSCSVSKQLAATVAEKICVALAEPYSLQPNASAEPVSHVCTASIGIALFRGAELGMDEVLSRADNAMYQAKHDGGDRAHMYSD